MLNTMFCKKCNKITAYRTSRVVNYAKCAICGTTNRLGKQKKQPRSAVTLFFIKALWFGVMAGLAGMVVLSVVEIWFLLALHI